LLERKESQKARSNFLSSTFYINPQSGQGNTEYGTCFVHHSFLLCQKLTTTFGRLVPRQLYEPTPFVSTYAYTNENTPN
jgi:hypothetical protein